MIKTDYISNKVNRGFEIKNKYEYPSYTQKEEWLSVFAPDDYNVETHKLINLKIDYINNRVVASIRLKTADELQNEAIEKDEAEKQNLIDNKARIDAETALVAEVEEIPIDDAEAMQASIPLQKWWSDSQTVVGSVLSGEPFDVRKDFDSNNVIRLWKCKQGHTTQAGWRPKDTPALWEMIPFPGEYFAYDPMVLYSKDDIVYFPNVGDDLYKSKIDNNSWSPTGYPQGWEIYEDD